MEAASIRDLKKELQQYDAAQLAELCLKLAKFKKENKEFLTYLVYEADDEMAYIEHIQEYLDEEFAELEYRSAYFLKKGVRKILRQTKKFIRFSKQKRTEVELLLHFCRHVQKLNAPGYHGVMIDNLFDRQVKMIRNAIARLHEDLQHDYTTELDEMLES